MKKIAIELFLYLGGTALVLGIVKKSIPTLVSRAFGALLLNPSLKNIIISHRKEIEDIFDEIDQEIKKDLEDSAGKN